MQRNMLVGLVFALFALLAAEAASAQGASNCVPAPTNMPNAGYPRVCPDYRVIFKLEAPQARKVQLQPNIGAGGSGLGAGPFDLVKGADGVWSLTLGPVRPGFHYYVFLVDGLAVSDPGSDAFSVGLGTAPTLGLNFASSAVEVREKGVSFDLPKDVPHGVVQELWYKSKVSGEYRRVMVYVPPGYDKSLTSRYPVLYLSHGANNFETSWTREGHVGAIMDNLLAEKKIVPMLVVMDRGYGSWLQTSPEQTGRYDPKLHFAAEEKDEEVYPQVLIKDLIPTIDGRYRTIADREHRALSGLSHGSEQAIRIGATNLDTFAYIAALSPSKASRLYAAAPTKYAGGLLNNAGLLNSRLKLFWMGDGTAEAGHKDIVKLDQALTKNGVKHSYYQVPGTAHEWITWRRHLANFAPLLFRGAS